MKYLLLSLHVGLMATVVVVLNVSNVLALEDQFTVRLNVIGVDTDAPSTPINVVATGVSVSQIDIAWDAATDNTGVAGYTIARDGVPLATTTLTAYSDTGLVSATTYGYTIQAFDASSNYSSSSATSSATTLTPAPPTPSSTASNLSGSRPFFNLFSQDLRLEYINISPLSDESLRVEFTMNQPVMATLFWGQTADYELGSASHILLNANQVFIIDELKPEVRYYIKIEVTNILGRKAYMGPYSAQTRFTRPLNPHDLSGLSVSDGIVLSWRYPRDATYEVRLLRSENNYPADPFDGTLVYEGRATAVKDVAVAPGRRYYYTLFGVVGGNRYSSGAVTSVVHRQFSEPLIIAPPLRDFTDVGVGVLSMSQDVAIVPEGDRWYVRNDRPLSIKFSLPEGAQDALDRVIISFSDEGNALHNAYLLYFDPASHLFTGEINPGPIGVQSFVVNSYNSQGDVVHQVSGTLIVEPVDLFVSQWSWWSLLLLIVRCLLSLFFIIMGWLTFAVSLWH